MTILSLSHTHEFEICRKLMFIRTSILKKFLLPLQFLFSVLETINYCLWKRNVIKYSYRREREDAMKRFSFVLMCVCVWNPFFHHQNPHEFIRTFIIIFLECDCDEYDEKADIYELFVASYFCYFRWNGKSLN